MNTPSAGSRTPRRSPRFAPNQLSLFETDPAPTVVTHVRVETAPERVTRRATNDRRRAEHRDQSRLVTVANLPTYPEDARAAALQSVAQIPARQLWFTYKDLRFYFGVSRATVARRLREGLVPGVRMIGSSVVEDAAVRRFDREQLMWLLLAVRYRKRRATS